VSAAAIAPGKRVAKYNPGSQRHSWTKEREHHRRCDFCGLHVENRPGGGGYFQLWDWPAERGLPEGTNKGTGSSAVPKCPGPYVAPAPAAAVEGPKCSTCDEQLLALVPLVFVGGGRGGLVALAAADPAGEFVVARREGEWVVQAYDRARDQDVDPGMRRRVHKCSSYRYRCLGDAGRCPKRGRLYAIGTFCDDHPPRSR
jgi:hypothetical protein